MPIIWMVLGFSLETYSVQSQSAAEKQWSGVNLLFCNSTIFCKLAQISSKVWKGLQLTMIKL